ncbi:MAG: ribosome recycling factor [Bacteroidetes bacterium]|jgi:ribosome recycling factor|nr:ribosome recycling factor [Bacteroidota bacterium]MCL5034958.1 ribosome recycling factor [Bacteroidota bacterium]
MLDKIIHETEDKMKKAVDFTRQELTKLRSGKATVALLDDIRVDYYGQKMPIAQTASISAPDAHLVVVQPWDKSMIQEIEKAILAANIGLTPSNDGAVIRLPVPPLTEERRKELVKVAKKFSEDGRVTIRNMRRDSNEHLKKAEKDEHVSEDERKRGETEVQRLTDKYIKQLDDILAGKEKEILEV